MLKEKTAGGISQAVALAEMQRLTAAAAAARMVNDRPLALPAPGPVLALPEPTPTVAQDV